MVSLGISDAGDIDTVISSLAAVAAVVVVPVVSLLSANTDVSSLFLLAVLFLVAFSLSLSLDLLWLCAA